jgi:cytochrome P450
VNQPNRCPVDHSFDLLDRDFQSDPYPFFGGLQETPIFYAPTHDLYVVTRFADIDAILRDFQRFSSSNVITPITPLSAEAVKVLTDAQFDPVPTLLNADRPKHPLMRAYVASEINPRRLKMLEPVVREWVEDAVKRMQAKGTADVFTDLAFPLPAVTGLNFLGFPPEDLERLKEWGTRRVVFQYGRPTPEEQVRVAGATAEFWNYVKDFTATSITNPQDDFTGALVKAHLNDPEALTAADITNILFGVVLAAHETTTDLVLNGLRQLLGHRDQWDLICEDSSLIPNAVEECLRYDGSVLSLRRLALEDVEIGDVIIPAGSAVVMLIASANRDSRFFEQADVFDVRREAAIRHVTFGRGAHFCQGAPLARMEMRVVLETLSTVAPEVELVADQEFEFLPNITMRGPNSLLIKFSAEQ